MNLPEVLIRLLIAVLIYILGEKIIALAGNEKLREILTIILLVVVVVFVALGSFQLPIK